MGDGRRRLTRGALSLGGLVVFALVAAGCATLSSVVPPQAAVDAEQASILEATGDTTSDDTTSDDSSSGDGTPGDTADNTDDPATAEDAPSTDEGGADADSEGTDPPTSEQPPDDGVRVITPTVINTFPHDTAAFTQGLEYADGVLFESLGLRGESARRRVVPTTGEVSASAPLSAELFGAGLTIVGDTLYQLTLQSGTVVVADPTTLLAFDQRTIEGEGWGICAIDDQRLAVSNGTNRITFYDAATFTPSGSIDVTLDGEPVDLINELECVENRIWANVWLTSDIITIDVDTGNVVQRADATSLLPGDLGPDDVLNGIAHNPESNTFYVTGKRWSVLYEVDLGSP